LVKLVQHRSISLVQFCLRAGVALFDAPWRRRLSGSSWNFVGDPRGLMVRR
jgi:hypothetical protein